MGLRFVVVEDLKTECWEGSVIDAFGSCTLWINDRLATDAEHVRRLHKAGVPVVTFDDYGPGSAMSDLAISALAEARGESVRGVHTLSGLEYLVLPERISRYRRPRVRLENVVVSVGGSDTHSVTPKVAYWLRDKVFDSTIVIGPGAQCLDEVLTLAGPRTKVKKGVADLAEEFSRHDLAITGGGLTAFEAAAAGIPTLTIANEDHEVGHCQLLESIGASRYCGFRSEADLDSGLVRTNVQTMSRSALAGISLDGTDNVCREILKLTNNYLVDM